MPHACRGPVLAHTTLDLPSPAPPPAPFLPPCRYNTSASSGEVNAYGVPRGFFRSPGMASFPVLLDLNAPEGRLRWLLQYLVGLCV